jgi:hypothetical protein
MFDSSYDVLVSCNFSKDETTASTSFCPDELSRNSSKDGPSGSCRPGAYVESAAAATGF